MPKKIACTYQLSEASVKGLHDLHWTLKKPRQQMVDEAIQDYLTKHLNGHTVTIARELTYDHS